MSAADAVKQAVEQQQFQKATELWSVAETVVEQVGATQEGALHCLSGSLFHRWSFVFYCFRVTKVTV